MSQFNELCGQIDRAANAYYRPGLEPTMTDAEYDDLVGKLRALDPDNPRLTQVGPAYDPAEIGTKATHTIPMGSLDNLPGGIAGFDDWYQDLVEELGEATPEFQLTPKVDGSSLCLTYRAGKLVRATTRGNGEVGEDVTANAIAFQYVPTLLPEPLDLDVRGEAILAKLDFMRLGATSNPRNVGNGIIGRENGKDASLIRFLAFNCEGLQVETMAARYGYLTKLGFTTVPQTVLADLEAMKAFCSNAFKTRDQFWFEIDGVVVTLNQIDHQQHFVTADPKSRLRPKYARAVKPDVRMAQTAVTGLTVTVGHTGAIIPTAIVETVRIGGVNVSNVLLNNWEEVTRFGLGVGSQVTIGLAGEIIPKCLDADNHQRQTPFDRPLTCPCCHSPTTNSIRGKPGAVTYCTNHACPDRRLAKISQWVGTSKKGVGILGLGDSMLQALYRQGLVLDPADLYLLSPIILQDVQLDSGVRIGLSRATAIVQEIQGKRKLSLPVFLGSLGIDLLGRRRVVLLQQEASGALQTLSDWLDDSKLATLALRGLGDTIREAIRAGINDNRDLIARLLKVGVTVDYPEAPAPNTSKVDLSGCSFCFTGTRECLNDVVRLGGIIKSGVSKGLDFLVQLDATSFSNKTQKAEKYGTQIISVDYLKRAIAGDVVLSQSKASTPAAIEPTPDC